MMRGLGAGLTLLAMLLLSACGGNKTQGSAENRPAIKVTVVMAERRADAAVSRFVGSVTARNRADVSPRIAARVERIAVGLGSRVGAGDLLAELDARDLRSRFQQAEALDEQAAADLKRYESLLAQNVISRQQYDAVKAQAEVAAASRREAEAALSYTRIVAPFAGVVTARMIDAGDLANPGQPLFVVQDESDLRFVATIPESQVGRVRVGDSLRLEIGETRLIVTGRVDEISPGADPMSRSHEIKIDLPSDPQLRPGQFGRVLLASGDDSTIFVPATALVKRGQLDLVYVATGDNRAHLRLVRVGRALNGQLELLAGVESGERVITGGQSQLQDGDRIEIQP